MILEEIEEQLLKDKGREALLFGSPDFFKYGQNPVNFIFHYLREPVPEKIPTNEDFSIIPIFKFKYFEELPDVKIWMYEQNKKNGLDVFCARNDLSLLFFNIRPVKFGQAINPVKEHAITDYDLLRDNLPDFDKFNNRILGLKDRINKFF